MKTRDFLILAIAASALGHFISFSALDIVINSPVKSHRQFGDIMFLGSILEQSDFKGKTPFLSPKHETFYKPPVIAGKESALDVKPPEKMSFRKISSDEINSVDNITADKIVIMRKKEPQTMAGGKDIFYRSEDQITNKYVEGPLKARLILYRPPLPVFSKVLGQFDENLSSSFRVTVSGDGTVASVEPEVSSGYPRVDLDCENYLRQWRFAPKEPPDREESGTITIHMNAD